jgi:alkylated DNA nucleotide flippase Atl1
MRRVGLIVKRLARPRCIWHRVVMAKDAEDKERIKAERLREALRANLRRRKGQGVKHPGPDPSYPKSAD